MSFGHDGVEGAGLGTSCPTFSARSLSASVLTSGLRFAAASAASLRVLRAPAALSAGGLPAASAPSDGGAEGSAARDSLVSACSLSSTAVFPVSAGVTLASAAVSSASAPVFPRSAGVSPASAGVSVAPVEAFPASVGVSAASAGISLASAEGSSTSADGFSTAAFPASGA